MKNGKTRFRKQCTGNLGRALLSRWNMEKSDGGRVGKPMIARRRFIHCEVAEKKASGQGQAWADSMGEAGRHGVRMLTEE